MFRGRETRRTVVDSIADRDGTDSAVEGQSVGRDNREDKTERKRISISVLSLSNLLVCEKMKKLDPGGIGLICNDGSSDVDMRRLRGRQAICSLSPSSVRLSSSPSKSSSSSSPSLSSSSSSSSASSSSEPSEEAQFNHHSRQMALRTCKKTKPAHHLPVRITSGPLKQKPSSLAIANRSEKSETKTEKKMWESQFLPFLLSLSKLAVSPMPSMLT